jgi:Na+/melibiose symporter-like transporter
MSYRPLPDFDRPNAESVQRSRRAATWFIPLIILQQGTVIFGHESDRSLQIVGTVAWICLSLSMLWIFLGLPMRWLSERDQAIVNDERSRTVRGDAACWGIAALLLIGSGMMVARLWVQLNAGIAIYGLANGALVVSLCRYGWLNRAEPDEDE